MQHNKLDRYDRVARYGEWTILYNLGKDEKGLLQKDTILAAYDGTLFQQLANQKAPIKKHK